MPLRTFYATKHNTIMQSTQSKIDIKRRRFNFRTQSNIISNVLYSLPVPIEGFKP